MPVETKLNNGVVTPPASASAPARITVPDAPVTGAAGEALLTSALTNVFVGVEETVAEHTDAPGNEPGQTEPKPGGAGKEPENLENPPDDNADAELAARAKANGVTAEEQEQAETVELDRLTAKGKELGLTPEQVQAQEAEEAEAGAGGVKQFTQEEVEGMVQKRVAKAQARIAELETKLAEGGNTTAAAPATDPLANVFSGEKLAKIQEDNEAGLEYAERNLQRMNYASGKVEKELRALASANPTVAEFFKNGNDEDFSQDRMVEFLESGRDRCKSALKAVPKRVQYLKLYGQIEGAVKKIAPEIFDVESEAYPLVQKILAEKPFLKNSATWPYDIAAFLEGHKVLQERLKKAGVIKGANGNGAVPKKFIPAVKFPRTAGRGGAVPLVNGDRLKAAKARLAKSGSEKDLDAVLAEVVGG